jgi:hypothetical protein
LAASILRKDQMALNRLGHVPARVREFLEA